LNAPGCCLDFDRILAEKLDRQKDDLEAWPETLGAVEWAWQMKENSEE